MRGSRLIARAALRTQTRQVLAAMVIMGASALTVTPVLGQSAKSNLTDPAQAERFNSISDRLVCQCGCNMILRVCNHFECPSALPMRAEIEEKILAGESDGDIVDGFVAQYGKVVMSTPPAEGINLAAWVMPGFAILLGLFIVVYFAADMLAKRKVRPATATAPSPDPAMLARIEAELKKMDS